MVNSGVLAAIHVLRMRCDPCGAVLMFLLLSIFETLFWSYRLCGVWSCAVYRRGWFSHRFVFPLT